MKRISVVAAVFSFLSQVAFSDAISDRLERVKALSDEVLTVGRVGFHAKEDAPSKDPLWMFRSMDESSEAAPTGGFVRVDFTLAPESGSFIRCRAELPLPEKWNGTFWGRGNSGYAGSIPRLRGFAANGDAAVTTDLGTGRITNGGRSAPERWTDAARKDFDWRATHLMTVYGKRIATAFYGVPPKRSYFNGGSTGGRQAMSEAIRFPSDYDGIIAHLPDNNAMAVEVGSWHLYRQTHDENGRLLFTTNEMRLVTNAAVEFRRKSDPKPYAGTALADPRFSESEIDGFLALAAKKCPSLRQGDKLRRLKSIYAPLSIDGRCVFNGYAPGSYLVPRMNKMGIAYLRAYLNRLGISESAWGRVGEHEIAGFIREYSPAFNACSGDLSAFRRRGGKLIMTAGWEDQTIPPGLIVDYYERVVEADGGLDRTLEYFRLFCVAGCAHGGGKGSIITGAPGGAQVRRKLADWVEKGIAPDSLPCRWADRKTVIPVAVYPGLSVQDENGWSVRTMKRGAAARLRETVSATKVWPLEGETVTLSNAVSSLVIETYGARIVSWLKNGSQMLWMPKVRQGGCWEHGGIPVCWPTHGRNQIGYSSIHGTAWSSNFRVLSKTESAEKSVIELGCEWSRLSLVYRIELDENLTVEMRTVNHSSEPMKVVSAIHPYFRVGDISAVKVNGRGFDGPFDKGFACSPGDAYVIDDKSLERRISVCAEMARRFVVWTPWTQLEAPVKGIVAPLEKGEYRSFIAVEPVSGSWKDASALKPGGSHRYRAVIRVSE